MSANQVKDVSQCCDIIVLLSHHPIGLYTYEFHNKIVLRKTKHLSLEIWAFVSQ